MRHAEGLVCNKPPKLENGHINIFSTNLQENSPDLFKISYIIGFIQGNKYWLVPYISQISIRTLTYPI